MTTTEKIAWFLTVILVLVAIFIIAQLPSWAKNIKTQSFAQGYCLEAGYPQYIEHNGLHYCVKTVNSTDIIIRIEKILMNDKDSIYYEEKELIP